eukprot:656545-Hanusia_phi.AAC.2
MGSSAYPTPDRTITARSSYEHPGSLTCAELRVRQPPVPPAVSPWRRWLSSSPGPRIPSDPAGSTRKSMTPNQYYRDRLMIREAGGRSECRPHGSGTALSAVLRGHVRQDRGPPPAVHPTEPEAAESRGA